MTLTLNESIRIFLTNTLDLAHFTNESNTIKLISIHQQLRSEGSCDELCIFRQGFDHFCIRIIFYLQLQFDTEHQEPRQFHQIGRMVQGHIAKKVRHTSNLNREDQAKRY